jgi:hypothetical protein
MTDNETTKMHRLCSPRSLIGIALIATLLTAPAFATTVPRLNLDQLVQRADLIVQGHVESVYSQWDEERRLVFTYISIRVDESFKGERRRSVLIRQVGGTVGTIQMSIAGVPQFKSGEMAIVFLKHLDDSAFQVVGMSQGLYKIVENFAVSNMFGVDLFDSRTGEISKPLIGGRAPLEQLKTKIRELVR